MSAMRKRKPIEANDGSYGGAVLAAFDQMAFPMGTLHVCPRCGVAYRCDEENCVGRPGERELTCADCSKYFSPHSQWGGHRARRDPVWAAKLARMDARQKCSQPLQIATAESSPCDLTKLDAEIEPKLQVIRGELVRMPANSVMGAEMLDPTLEGKVK